jgi:muramoyltetrapeptide carboxypeptidase
VLAAQKAVLMGHFTVHSKSPLDRGYSIRAAGQHLRTVCDTPILTGLPFGHVPTKLTLPVGARVQLTVQGREVFIAW